jgi:ABC-2 type transport system permease protein
MRQRIADIWSYRQLLVGMTRKELKIKYKNSVLGFVWSMLNPATSLVVFYVVFQVVLKNGIPFFAIFLISGILVWNVFQNGLTGACGSIVGNSAIVKKVAFPRETLPLASVGAGLVHFVLQSVVLIFFLFVFRYLPDFSYLWLLIPALAAAIVLTSAIGVMLAAVNVKLRDTQHLLEIALQVWFWATPIVYPYRLVADRITAHSGLFSHILFFAYRLNPVTPIVLTFQRAIYGRPEPFGPTVKGPCPAATPGTLPGVPTTNGCHTRVAILPAHVTQWWYLWQLLAVMGFSAALFLFALSVFGRREGTFAEEL